MAAKKKPAPKKASSVKKAPARKAAKKAPAKKKAPARKAAKKTPTRKVAKKAKQTPAKKAPRRPSKPKLAVARALESLRLEAVLPAAPRAVLDAWLDSAAHTAFTGAEAFIDPRVGGKHSAWSGYIEGQLTGVEDDRLVMTWRTSEFAPTDPDSHLEVHVAPHPEGSRIEVVHTRLPVGGRDKYAKGWEDFYFAPMRAHFAR